MTVQTSHDGGSGRRADTVSTKTVFENHPGLGQPVDVWRRRQLQSILIGRDGLRGQVIAEEEDDVGTMVIRF